MNIEQCQTFLIKLKDIMSLTSVEYIRGLVPLWLDQKLFKSIKFKNWKIRYVPGKAFAFNGKQKFFHQIFYYRYDNEIFGLKYFTNYKNFKIFYISEEKVKRYFRFSYMRHIIDNRVSIIYLNECSQEDLDRVLNSIKEDIEESLSIHTDDDFNDLMRMIDLIGIQNL